MIYMDHVPNVLVYKFIVNLSNNLFKKVKKIIIDMYNKHWVSDLFLLRLILFIIGIVLVILVCLPMYTMQIQICYMFIY